MTDSDDKFIYTGHGKPAHRKGHVNLSASTFLSMSPEKPDVPKPYMRPEPYIPDDELIDAVNLSIFLGRPLLLEGEPGCGKSRLAYSLAYELNVPLYTWEIRSTDRVQDGLYKFDGLARLYDANIAKTRKSNSINPSLDVSNYITPGAIGKAFEASRLGYRPVLLIDEIDKADLDFPNDLLNILESPHEFRIKELDDKRIQADPSSLPIVIITSNREKGDLPAPFLRRCVYHYVRFPDKEKLVNIIKSHVESRPNDFRNQDFLSANQFQDTINQFMELRGDKKLQRVPGTSELIDWVRAITQFTDAKSEPQKIPHKGLLFKTRLDWQTYGK